LSLQSEITNNPDHRSVALESFTKQGLPARQSQFSLVKDIQ
jgi:hypothetical protein